MLNLFSGSKFHKGGKESEDQAPEGSEPDDTSILYVISMCALPFIPALAQVFGHW